MENTEREIIRQCQQGNLKQFDRLYDQYVKKIYNFIYFRTYHRETAEDLTSQTFLSALKKIDQFNPDKGAFSSWLYRIALNATIDHIRTNRPTFTIDDFFDLAGNEDVATDIDVRESMRQVENYLEKLKPEQRQIVIFRLWDNLSYEEIAEITGQSVGSCKMSFSRTMHTLRHDLAGLLLLILTVKLLS